MILPLVELQSSPGKKQNVQRRTKQSPTMAEKGPSAECTDTDTNIRRSARRVSRYLYFVFTYSRVFLAGFLS